MQAMNNNATDNDILKSRQIDQDEQNLHMDVYYNDLSKFNVPHLLTHLKIKRMYQIKKRKCVWKTVIVICTGLLLLMLLGGGALGVGYYYYLTNIRPSLTSFERPVSRGQSEPVLSQQPVDTSMITGRSWNILLLGSDNDGKFAFPQILTQVMMVVHIDTTNNAISLVSIPRDSWVPIPEVGGMHKIDQAFLLGSQRENSFEGGVRLARLTIEQDYGINIDRYAWVGLSGFASMIDILGGVDVDITHPIVDDTYPDDSGTHSNPNNPYAYTRLYLAPGPQHLTGEQALQYVRTRHSDQIGDIGRTERQQQLLEALKLKFTSYTLLENMPQLLKSLKNKFYTDLSEQEMLAMANYGRTLSHNAVKHITLGPGQDKKDYGDLTTLYDPSLGMNQDVIVPHCENIQPVINHIFELGNIQSCNISGSD
jgi:LCP family protein required for cell wall assembly